MPNAKVLSEKQAAVAALAEKMKNASAGVFVDYKGITVEADTKFRADLRKNNVEYAVVKNTLTRFAANQIGFEELDPILNGTTALAMSMEDPIAPARLVGDFIKKSGKTNFAVKGGFVEGKVVDIATIMSLMPSPSSRVKAQLPLKLPKPQPNNFKKTFTYYFGGKSIWLAKT